ncbi:MAG: ADP-ribosyltransferase [Candidatus Bruticola sp.]
MNINSVNMQSFIPSCSSVKTDAVNKAVPEQSALLSSADIFESSLSSISNEVTTVAPTAESAAKHKPQLSDHELTELLEKIVSNHESEPPSASGSASLTMGEADFQAAGLGSLSLKGLSSGPIPTLDLVKDYKYISESEATDNYNNNVKSDLKMAERGCIKAYCTVAYQKMNGYLLGNVKSRFGVVRKASECMTHALERHSVPQGSVLYRTASLAELRNYMTAEEYDKVAEMQLDLSPAELTPYIKSKISGTQSNRKTFLSTTIDHKFDFQDKPKVATKIYVGDNVKGIYVAADEKLTRFPDEKEYLLAPGTKMTVMDVEYSEKNKGFVLHVFAGDVPRSEA